MLAQLARLAELVEKGLIDLRGSDKSPVVAELRQFREGLFERNKELEALLARIDKIIAEWKAANAR